MNREKYVYFFLDDVELDFSDPCTCITYNETKKAIDEEWWCIHTTSLANLSFDLLDKDYKIYLVMNGKELELKPGMKESDKEIKRQHNILRIVLSGYFNEYFK